jgi:hypothetical protein
LCGLQAVAEQFDDLEVTVLLKLWIMPTNDLYLAVLPLIRVPKNWMAVRAGVFPSGSVEQYLTLYSDRNLASEFYPDEVQTYIDLFNAHVRALTGGHVSGYHVSTELTDDGRVVVKVVQHVTA